MVDLRRIQGLLQVGLALGLGLLGAGCESIEPVHGDGHEEDGAVVAMAVLQSTPAALMRLKTATFTFAATGADAFVCQLDGGPAAPCESPYTTPVLADGSHVFAVSAQDAAGNLQPEPTVYQWAIDSTLAGIVFSAVPASYTNQATVILEFSSDEADMTYTCALDGAAPVAATATSTGAQCPVTAQGDGEHHVVVSGSNAIGDQSATHEWVLDRARPIFTKVSEQKGGSSYALSYTSSEYAAIATCTVTWTVGSATQSATVPCGLDAARLSGQISIARGTSFPACRSFTLRVELTDRAGNDLLTDYTSTFMFNPADNSQCAAQQPQEEQAS